jgi:hypothetical protein
MSEIDHSYETEQAQFDAEDDDYPYGYEDPVEARLGNIEQHLVAQQEEVEEAAADEGFEGLLERHPMLQHDDVAGKLVDKAQELADEIERERNQPGLAVELLGNPQFAEDVWVEHFNAGEGMQLSGDSLFLSLAAEAKANRLSWD